ncbi:MAG: hypothetical protein JM58_15870 [Peptococcaceae bacterium BICA1-8]|nr:MAG: hypothetical protein JM58_15870 [Peptococcaceae bacterium BICA1-8]
MNYFKKWSLLTIVVISVLFVFGCGIKAPEETQEVKVKVIPVETLEVTKGEFKKTLTLSGVTNPNNTLNVTPKIAGAEKVININIKEGDKVNKGQTLALLDQSTILIQQNQVQKVYDDALINYERNKALYEVGAIPKANFEQIETTLYQAKNNLDAQKLALNNTIVKAPISGIVTAVNVVEGGLVTAQTPLSTIVDVSSLEINTSINEIQIKKVAQGQEVEIIVPSASDKVYNGKINYISPVTDERTKSYPIKIKIDNSKGELKAGMYAKIGLTTDVLKDVVKIPRKAVTTRDGENRVFVVEEGKAVLKKVNTGLSNETDIEIIDGLNVGEKLIITGNEDIVHGDLVTIVNRGEN